MMFASMVLATALAAPAQEPPRIAAPSFIGRVAKNDDDAPSSAMSEDVEIFRQIVKRKLHQLSTTPNYYRTGTAADGSVYYGQTGQTVAGSLWSSNGLGRLQTQTTDGMEVPVEGAYLPGCGVVFTVTLPAAARDVKSKEPSGTHKALTEWERTQRELRGEKPEITPPLRAGQLSARSILIQAIADNGSHFSRLRDDERLTIVAVFRDEARHGFWTTGVDLPTTTAATVAQSAQASPFGQSALSAAGSKLSTGKPPSSGHDYELLGDLHLKQLEYEAAAEAYARAASKYREESKGDPAADDANRLADIYAKQAQAKIGQRSFQAAADLIGKAQSLRDRKAPKADAKPAARETRLPVKLIITATKRQIDQLAGGKMTPDEFRKELTIEEQR